MQYSCSDYFACLPLLSLYFASEKLITMIKLHTYLHCNTIALIFFRLLVTWIVFRYCSLNLHQLFLWLRLLSSSWIHRVLQQCVRHEPWIRSRSFEFIRVCVRFNSSRCSHFSFLRRQPRVITAQTGPFTFCVKVTLKTCREVRFFWPFL